MSCPRRATTRRIQQGDRSAVEVQLPVLKIEVEEGPDRGLTFSCPGPSVGIGTDGNNQVVLTDETVSRHHARLIESGGGIHFQDLDSSNGSFLEAHREARREAHRIMECVLKPGDRIRVGRTILRIRQENRELTGFEPATDHLGEIVGRAPVMKELFGFIGAVAHSPVTVLLRGESGTGKEVVAHQIHIGSGRSGTFVPFNCGRKEDALFASSLFGHRKGAFTGAEEERLGAFRSADGGTLFLDEIGELPLDFQPLLLRVLESREVQPVGSDRRHPVDVRIVCATNRDLAEQVEAGRFRDDLYYRINVLETVIPPLREREGDVPLLIEALTSKLGVDLHVGTDVMKVLSAFPWPGNVRQLLNAIQRLGILCRGREVREKDLAFLDGLSPATARSREPAGEASEAPLRSLDKVEAAAIREAYHRLEGNKMQTARALGISLSTLKRKLKDLELE